MAPVYALAVLTVVFAFAEIIGEKTKALISTVLAVALMMMVLFWTGLLPADVMVISVVGPVSGVIIPLMLAGIGTMIDLQQFKTQWKTIINALICMVSGVGLILLVGPLLLDRMMVFAGAPIFAGTQVATIMMSAVFEERNMPEVVTFVIVVFVTQSLIGIPISSILLRKEAKRFIQDPENIKKYSAAVETVETERGKRRLLEIAHPAFSKPSFIFAKLAIVAGIAFFLSNLTQGHVHFLVMALLMGILFKELGFLEKNVMARTDSAGWIIFVITVFIFANLAQTTPQTILSMMLPLLVVLGIGVIGVSIAGFIIAKILGISPLLAIPVGLTCTYGFPATFLMPKEVGKAIGRNEEEEAAIVNYILPNMVVAGFASVTITSVFVAGWVINLLPPA